MNKNTSKQSSVFDKKTISLSWIRNSHVHKIDGKLI